MTKRKSFKKRAEKAVDIKLDYTDIGHKDTDSLLWVYNYFGKLDVRPITEGTHNSIWGIKAMGMWRGRYEPKTSRISVVPPLSYKSENVPDYVVAAIEERFHGTLEPIMFNPDKRNARKLRRYRSHWN